MPFIVYTNPHAKRERVFLCGLGTFEHAVPRDVDAAIVARMLGDVVDGHYALNWLFSPVAPAVAPAVEPAPAPLPPAEAAQQDAPTAHEGDPKQ
jgi:hypothetical protein